MIIGSVQRFAIESSITTAYESESLRGLGYFNLHLCNRRYGVFSPDATMLACSLDNVVNRVRSRGAHCATFSTMDAELIADTFLTLVYSNCPHGDVLGMPAAMCRDQFYSSHLIWAPDGDEAFDDGSFVFQFDVDERVRLIAFNKGDGSQHIPGTLCDLWLTADEYYGVLDQWQKDFLSEWRDAPKAMI